MSDEPPALAYIERTLSEAYRKEIDQEENVWRSLPFFAATLALQLAALSQVVDKLPGPGSIVGWLSILCLAAAGCLPLMSLSFLLASIFPQKFDYVAEEPALLAYANELIDSERLPANQSQLAPVSALVTLKAEIARQYAQATVNNRRINKRRERRRSIAGVAALGSVFMTVFLVATAYVHYLSIRLEDQRAHATIPSVLGDAVPSTGPGRADQRGHAGNSSGAGATSDAGRH